MQQGMVVLAAPVAVLGSAARAEGVLVVLEARRLESPPMLVVLVELALVVQYLAYQHTTPEAVAVEAHTIEILLLLREVLVLAALAEPEPLPLPTAE